MLIILSETHCSTEAHDDKLYSLIIYIRAKWVGKLFLNSKTNTAAIRCSDFIFSDGREVSVGCL